MKTIASSSFVHSLVYAACALLSFGSLGFGSCGASSGGSGIETADSGAPDAGSGGGDAAVHVDSGGAADSAVFVDTGTGAPDAGSEDGGGEDAGFCGPPESGAGATCDGCLQTNCEQAWCQCAAGEPDPDGGDAGSGCLQYVQCVEDCVEDDGGSPTDCITKLCAVAPFTNPQQQAGHAYLDCLVQYCATACGQ